VESGIGSVESGNGSAESGNSSVESGNSRLQSGNGRLQSTNGSAQSGNGKTRAAVGLCGTVQLRKSQKIRHLPLNGHGGFAAGGGFAEPDGEQSAHVGPGADNRRQGG